MIRLETISSDKKTVLYNFLQKYLYELSQYYYNEMNEEGNFVYKYFPNYFTDPDRYAYFICDDDKYVGFVLINPFSFTGEPIDYSIAEFTIFPAYRARGNAMQAIDILTKRHKGTWQLKYSLLNQPASKFWRAVKEKYKGVETVISSNELAITFR